MLNVLSNIWNLQELLRQKCHIRVCKLSTCLKRRHSSLRNTPSPLLMHISLCHLWSGSMCHIQSCVCGGICQHVCARVIRRNHLSCRCWVSCSRVFFQMSGRFRGPLCLHHFMGQTLNIMRLLNTVTMTTDTECVWEKKTKFKKKSGNTVWGRLCVKENGGDREMQLDVVVKGMGEFLFLV